MATVPLEDEPLIEKLGENTWDSRKYRITPDNEKRLKAKAGEIKRTYPATLLGKSIKMPLGLLECEKILNGGFSRTGAQSKKEHYKAAWLMLKDAEREIEGFIKPRINEVVEILKKRVEDLAK